MSDHPLLSVRHLSVHDANGSPVLEGVDLDLFPGTLTACVGESGSGKTSLINAVLGYLPIGLTMSAKSILLRVPQISDYASEEEGHPPGSIELYGMPTSPRQSILGKLIGYVPQDAISA